MKTVSKHLLRLPSVKKTLNAPFFDSRERQRLMSILVTVVQRCNVKGPIIGIESNIIDFLSENYQLFSNKDLVYGTYFYKKDDIAQILSVLFKDYNCGLKQKSLNSYIFIINREDLKRLVN